MSYKYCCDDFEQARRGKTDNEGYGPLVEVEDGWWVMGMDLAPIVHCPWCGVRLRPPPPQPEGQ